MKVTITKQAYKKTPYFHVVVEKTARHSTEQSFATHAECVAFARAHGASQA